MKCIGLTGNIGTGKSTVARIFEVMGVPVYHADKQARLFLDTDEVKQQIALFFGENLINTLHQVDRQALAKIVFNDQEKLAVLNNLIHPLVETDFLAWCKLMHNEAYILHEAAILFESGFNRLFEANILVTAPEQICISRVMARDNLSHKMVKARIQNQWSQEKKIELSDYVVVNDGKSMVIPQILSIHNSILNS
jgi:dephospho-CoA kinase